MAVIVKNTGVMDKQLTNANTKGVGARGDQGTVRVVYQGREWTFGPNQSITFSDDGIGTAVAAIDSRLTLYPADTWR